MKSNSRMMRIIFLAAVVISILLLYSLRLMDFQVVNGEMYEQMIEQNWESVQTIKAARGEILDRNGRPLAMNTIGRDVVIDQAFLEPGTTNAVILRLIGILEEADEDWIDNLPITMETPFSFITGYDSADAAVLRLKRFLGLAEYATVEDVVYHLKRRYQLESHGDDENPIPYTDEEFRKIAGVRYEMSQQGFSYRTPYTFASNIKIETVPLIKERSFELAGVDVVESTIRQYVAGDIAPQIVGQIGKIYQEQWQQAAKEGGYTEINGINHVTIDGQLYSMNDVIGKDGAELAFEGYLKGKDGERKVIVKGQDVIDVLDTSEPVPGNTVVLTIDSRIQKVAQDALERKILLQQETYPEGRGKEANAGAVAVVDCKTGEALALASYPSYSLTTYQQDYPELARSDPPRLINRAVSGRYTPGSIFKPLVATSALASGVTTPLKQESCGLVYTRFPDYPAMCEGSHGLINVMQALQWSCNIYFYETGYNMGIETLDRYAEQFGIGQPTGIEVGENVGQMSSPALKQALHKDDSEWQPGDIIQTSIGQLDTMLSPLQMANYAATLANNGQRMKVTLLKSVKNYTLDETIYEHEPEVAATVDASPEVFATVRQGMVNASHIGTARGTFAGYPIQVASKTGSPQAPDGINSTFIAYAPANDPEIAVAVVMEKGWEGFTSAPIVKEIFDAYFFGGSGKTSAPTEFGVLLP